jgi:hypothetical protein
MRETPKNAVVSKLLPWALAAGLGCSIAPRDERFDMGENTGEGPDGGSEDGVGPGDGEGETNGEDTSGGGDGDGVLFDVGDGSGDGDPCEEGGDCPDCEIPEHTPCDDDDDPAHAMGLDCPGEQQLGVQVNGAAEGIGTRSSFGPTGTWNPREGSKYAVIASGFIADLDYETPDADAAEGPHANPTYCNDDLGMDFDPYDPPAPLRMIDVGGVDCEDDPTLIGTGDCSNTLQGQFDQGEVAYDYTEVRFTAPVPITVNSFSYDFAYFTTEYPFYSGRQFNDMYVAWLESEKWTGNISFDEVGNPISLNASFLDFKDDDGTSPDLAGTCMRYHAGTKWLSTTAAVKPGETIVVVFAVFDLADNILDSYVFLDNFQWGCDGDDPPSTKPVG